MLVFKKKTSYSKKKQRYSINFFHYFGVFSFIVAVLFLTYTIPFVKYGFNRIIFNNNLDTLNFFASSTKLTFEKIFGPSYFSVNTPKKTADFLKKSIFENFNFNKIDKLELNIDYENLQILEKQRLKKKTNQKWAVARATYFNLNDESKKKIKIKLRAKGDRDLHRENLKQMSFKVDIIGKDRIYGLEEFSIQKPIIRNYSLEILASKAMLINDILAPKTKIINLYLNGENRGIYHIEEGFSKEILELNKRKNGPIFGIDDNYSVSFPNVNFDIYSKAYWEKNNPELLIIARSKLEHIKYNYNKEDFDLFQYFDLQKWAKFFALSDILAAHHGAKIDSVKFFYNSTIEKFEPIFFDGHINSGTSKTNILLSDFINLNDQKKKDMGYLIEYKDWFKLFFNKSKFNEGFLKLYHDELARLIDDKFQQKMKKLFIDIEPYNRIYYSKFMPSDGIWSGSILPFYFDKTFFSDRNAFIKNKLNELKSLISQYNIEPSDNFYYKKNDNNLFTKSYLDLNDNVYFLKDIKLIEKKINFTNPSILFLKGNNSIEKSYFSGPVMLVQKEGKLKIYDTIFDGLQNVNVKSTNWTGSINTINTISDFSDVVLKNIYAEDALNFVNSSGILKNIKIVNSSSDAVDIDFGKFSFDNLTCRDIKNDCLDVSGSVIKGTGLYGYGVNDKVLSSGEKSLVEISNFLSENSEIGIVSKDSSKVIVNKVKFKNTKLHGAAFKKKEMFEGKTYLSIQDQSIIHKNDLNDKYLVSLNSNLKINDKIIKSSYTSDQIENMMYGNIYGSKTSK